MLDSRKKAADVYFTFRNRKLFESVTPLVLNKKFLKIDPQRIAVAVSDECCLKCDSKFFEFNISLEITNNK